MYYVISANRLADGLVVFRRDDGSWTREFASGRVVEGKEACEAALAAARGDVAGNRVVELELIELARHASSFVPARLRDRIRIAGPSVTANASPASSQTVRFVEADHVSI